MISQSATVVLLLISTAFAETVHWSHCASPDDDQSQCTITNVDVNPCKEAESNLPCSLKLGRDAQISFNYTTTFNATAATSQAYWVNPVMDLPLVGMNTEACKNTDCPIIEGQPRNYSIKLAMSKLFPKNAYDVKWKLWSEKTQYCCFVIKIKLV